MTAVELRAFENDVSLVVTAFKPLGDLGRWASILREAAWQLDAGAPPRRWQPEPGYERPVAFEDSAADVRRSKPRYKFSGRYSGD